MKIFTGQEKVKEKDGKSQGKWIKIEKLGIFKTFL